MSTGSATGAAFNASAATSETASAKRSAALAYHVRDLNALRDEGERLADKHVKASAHLADTVAAIDKNASDIAATEATIAALTSTEGDA